MLIRHSFLNWHLGGATIRTASVAGKHWLSSANTSQCGLRTESGLIAPYPETMDTRIDWKLELVFVPVSDVDRAKAFYVDQVGFNPDHDHTVSPQMRFVQLTPRGSACSIAIGTGLSTATPGSIDALQMVVADIEAAQAELKARGVQVSDIQNLDWGRFVFFSDPDGNRWAVQQLPKRG
jgi:predicted enzyme related to lactoylglutathione lyase